MNRASLPRPLVNQILHHAQSNPETEVCGLIASRQGRAERIYPIENVAELKGTLFQMDPEGQIDAMRTMRESGQTLFAIYHSHPHAPAVPSKIDLEQAAYPEALYLIISLNTKGVLEMRGYQLQDGAIEVVELKTAE